MLRLIAGLFAFVIAATAQSQEAPVYVEQFANLRTSMERIVSEASNAQLSADAIQALPSQIFALQKVAHRLQEGAGDADFESQKQGHKTDKRLRLVALGCMSIDSVLTALKSFLDTKDRAFISLAADARKSVDFIAKIL